MKAIIPAAGHGTRFLPVTRVVPKEMLPIGSKPALELIVDEAKTTAARVQHAPEFAGIVLTHDKPWEGGWCMYHNLVRDGDLLRIYYKNQHMGLDDVHSPGRFYTKEEHGICLIESRDGGLTWTRPNVNRYFRGGTRENNMVFPWGMDNFSVFVDGNPACPPEARYKAVALHISEVDDAALAEMDPVDRRRIEEGAANVKDPKLRKKFLDEKTGQKRALGLWCFTSPDGLDFKMSRYVTGKGDFDSLNTAFWDARRGEYVAYIRGYHTAKWDRHNDCNIRDIRVMASKDFRRWTEPKAIDFGKDAEDYSFYTNGGIQPYYRNPSVYVGFPARYVERKKWTKNYDRLCGAEERRVRQKFGTPREGLAIWDTVLAWTHDGVRFDRFDEAFLRPGPEHNEKNWNYGTAAFCYGMYESPGRVGRDREISMLALYGFKNGVPCQLARYVSRIDGFVSRQATYKEQKVVTKPFVFTGKGLEINFSTSARGYVYVTLRDAKGAELKSGEMFGDKVDRPVDFEGDLAAFAGRPVTLEFRMSDADLYSFRFR